MSEVSFDAGYAQAIKDVVEWLRVDCEGVLYSTVAALIESRFSAPSPEESE